MDGQSHCCCLCVHCRTTMTHSNTKESIIEWTKFPFDQTRLCKRHYTKCKPSRRKCPQEGSVAEIWTVLSKLMICLHGCTYYNRIYTEPLRRQRTRQSGVPLQLWIIVTLLVALMPSLLCEGAEHHLQPTPSSSDQLHNVVAPVGSAFIYPIPERGFDCEVNKFVVSESADRFLSAWLSYDDDKTQLYGVPSEKDLGTINILVVALTKSNVEGGGRICGSKSFAITVISLSDELPVSARLADLSRTETLQQAPASSDMLCAPGMQVALATVLVSVDIHDLNGHERMSAILKMAQHLNTSTRRVKIFSGESSHPVILQLDKPSLLVAGAGDGRFAKGPKSLLTWRITCGAISLRDAALSHLESNTQDGTLSSLLGFPVVGWHVMTGTQKSDVRRRVRRNVGGGCLGCTATPTTSGAPPTRISNISTTVIFNATKSSIIISSTVTPSVTSNSTLSVTPVVNSTFPLRSTTKSSAALSSHTKSFTQSAPHVVTTSSVTSNVTSVMSLIPSSPVTPNTSVVSLSSSFVFNATTVHSLVRTSVSMLDTTTLLQSSSVAHFATTVLKSTVGSSVSPNATSSVTLNSTMALQNSSVTGRSSISTNTTALPLTQTLRNSSSTAIILQSTSAESTLVLRSRFSTATLAAISTPVVLNSTSNPRSSRTSATAVLPSASSSLKQLVTGTFLVSQSRSVSSRLTIPSNMTSKPSYSGSRSTQSTVNSTLDLHRSTTLLLSTLRPSRTSSVVTSLSSVFLVPNTTRKRSAASSLDSSSVLVSSKNASVVFHTNISSSFATAMLPSTSASSMPIRSSSVGEKSTLETRSGSTKRTVTSVTPDSLSSTLTQIKISSTFTVLSSVGVKSSSVQLLPSPSSVNKTLGRTTPTGSVNVTFSTQSGNTSILTSSTPVVTNSTLLHVTQVTSTPAVTRTLLGTRNVSITTSTTGVVGSTRISAGGTAITHSLSSLFTSRAPSTVQSTRALFTSSTSTTASPARSVNISRVATVTISMLTNVTTQILMKTSVAETRSASEFAFSSPPIDSKIFNSTVASSTIVKVSSPLVSSSVSLTTEQSPSKSLISRDSRTTSLMANSTMKTSVITPRISFKLATSLSSEERRTRAVRTSSTLTSATSLMTSALQVSSSPESTPAHSQMTDSTADSKITSNSTVTVISTRVQSAITHTTTPMLKSTSLLTSALQVSASPESTPAHSQMTNSTAESKITSNSTVTVISTLMQSAITGTTTPVLKSTSRASFLAISSNVVTPTHVKSVVENVTSSPVTRGAVVSTRSSILAVNSSSAGFVSVASTQSVEKPASVSTTRLKPPSSASVTNATARSTTGTSFIRQTIATSLAGTKETVNSTTALFSLSVSVKQTSVLTHVTTIFKSSVDVTSLTTDLLTSTVMTSATHILSRNASVFTLHVTTALFTKVVIASSGTFTAPDVTITSSPSLNTSVTQGATSLGVPSSILTSTVTATNTTFPTPTQISTTTVRPTNSRPVLVNNIGRVTARVGKALNYPIPNDTFYDEEDGGTWNLKLRVTYLDNKTIPASYWLQFDPRERRLYGLPSEEDAKFLDAVGKEFVLIASDQHGKKAYDAFDVFIDTDVLPVVQQLSIRLKNNYTKFSTNVSSRLQLLDKIAAYYNDSDNTDIRVLSVSSGSVIFVWTNDSLPTSTCDVERADRIASNVLGEDGKFKEAFEKALLPEFPVVAASELRLGACDVTPTEPGLGLVSKSAGDLWYMHVLTGILAVVLLIILAILLVCWLRRRKPKPFKPEKRTYKKRKPIILYPEIEMKEFPGKPLVLPHDDPSQPPSYMSETSLDGSPHYYSDEEDYAKRSPSPPIYEPPPPFYPAIQGPRSCPPPMYKLPPLFGK